MTDNRIFLRTAGDRIATRSGHPVSLRGVSLGGWMNMENFITGFPATESLQRGGWPRKGKSRCYLNKLRQKPSLP